MKQIAEKILSIMADIGYIQKDGKNKFQNYSYVSESAAVTAIREAMIKHRVVAFPRVTAHNVIEAGTTKGGAMQFLTTTLTAYQFVDVDSGESVEVSLVGQGIDSGDKGAYKAATGVNKYVLMKVFQLATGDDPEKDDDSGNGKKGKTTKVQGKKPPKTEAPDDTVDRRKNILTYIGEHETKVYPVGKAVANARDKHLGVADVDKADTEHLAAYAGHIREKVKAA